MIIEMLFRYGETWINIDGKDPDSTWVRIGDDAKMIIPDGLSFDGKHVDRIEFDYDPLDSEGKNILPKDIIVEFGRKVLTGKLSEAIVGYDKPNGIRKVTTVSGKTMDIDEITLFIKAELT